jgi:tRNA-modifying protein YgfZ
MDFDGVGYCDRSERGKLRVTGEQRAWFLDQILTQFFEEMTPGEAREAAMITVHGRMQAHLEAVATGDSFLLHFEPELRGTLPEALARYIFATRVEVQDVSDELGLVLVAGAEWRSFGAAALVVHPTSSLGTEAGYLWVDDDAKGKVLEALGKGGAREATEDELETVRIANGVPRWGRDMDEKTFPQEAGVEGRAVHFDKGCYLGQEAMAKIHFRGKVNRRLRTIEPAGPVVSGTDVVADGQKVGSITSVAGLRALAMLRYSIEPGTEVTAGDTPARVIA